MLQLTISDKDPAQVALKERIEDLSLSRKITINNALKLPVLKHDHEVYEGSEKISRYLDEFEVYMKNWYACRCDMFEE